MNEPGKITIKSKKMCIHKMCRFHTLTAFLTSKCNCPITETVELVLKQSLFFFFFKQNLYLHCNASLNLSLVKQSPCIGTKQCVQFFLFSQKKEHYARQ